MTPLPPVEVTITADNIQRISALAVWGKGQANDIALSPDGQILAVGTNIGATLYDSLSYENLALLQTLNPVQSIAFSSDNQLFALGQGKGVIDIIDRRDYSLITRLSPTRRDLPENFEFSLNFSPDDDDLISVIKTTNGIFIERWETTSWQRKVSFSMDQGLAAYINPDLDLIGVIDNEDLTLQSLTYPEENDLLDLPAGISPAFWDRMADFGGEVAPASDGEFILINNGAAITHWRVLAEDFTYLLDNYPNKIPNPCYDAPDTCLNENGGFSWDCGDEPGTPPIELIALTPDDIMVLISLNNSRTEFRRASDSLLVWDIKATFKDVAFSPGGEFFFGLRLDGTIEKRTTLDGSLIDFIDQHPAQLYDLDFSPDSAVLAAGFSDGWIRVFSSANGKMLGVLNGEARALQFSPDGALLAAGLLDGTVRIFELDEGSYYDIAPGHLDAVTDLAFSADGNQLLTVSADCTASLWQVEERYRIRNLTPDSEDPFRVTEVDLSSDNLTQFFAGNRNGIFIVHETESNEVLLSTGTGVTDIALSPGNDILAVTGANSWLLLQPTVGLPPEPQPMDAGLASDGYALAFNPDGTLLTLATIQDLEFWSVGDAGFLANLQIDESPVPGSRPVSLVFAPSGSLIALGTSDGLIHIFGIPAN
jgi:WD40 repeat protein